MKRIFNVTGLCIPENHYMVDPMRGLNDTIDDLINNEYYFTIHAPRQSGKTTMLHALMKKINAEAERVCLVFSLETAGYRSITVKEANKNIIQAIIRSSKLHLIPEFQPDLSEKSDDLTMIDFLSQWCLKLPKPLVLLVDEIDSLYDDVLISVLRQFRDGFQFRPKGFPSSVSLVGLRDVREYKEKVRENDRSIGSGSPFNIKAKSLTIRNFSLSQIAELMQQYTDEGGQSFSDEIIDLFYSYTSGQPWLVNALANEIVVEILLKDTSKPITVELVVQAKENLILRRDTHLDSLIDKLHEPRIRPIIDAVISGADIQFNEYNDDLKYAEDLGIIVKDTNNNGVKISNLIYNEIIPRVLNANFQDLMIPKVELIWFIKPDGKLDMNALLREFQDFYREHAESWLDKFSYHESGKQLLLMAFLQRIVNGGGSIGREMAMGRGRTDLIIDFMGDRFVLELKIKRSNTNIDKAYKQLHRYLDTINISHGYLILFELKNSDTISWEERIKWNEMEYTFNGVKKSFTVVEM